MTEKRELPDYNLVQSYRTGSKDAYQKLMCAEGPATLNYIKQYIHNEDITDDVFQEAWLRIWRFRESLMKPNRFRSWMFQIVRNSIYDQLKSQNWAQNVIIYKDWEELVEAMDPSPGPREKASMVQWGEILQTAVAQLDPLGREMIAMRFSSDLNLREISEILNIPHGTICVRMSQAIRQIREHLESKRLYKGSYE